MRVESAHRDGDAGAQAQGIRPVDGQMPGDLVGGLAGARQLIAHARQQRIDSGQETLRRQPAPGRAPHPLVPHGAHAARHLGGIGDAAQHRGHVVAMLEGAGEAAALGGVVAQPVQQLGEAPLGGVDAAAPVDGLEALPVGRGGDLGGFLPRPVVAPQVVIVQRLHVGVHRNYGAPGGIERHGFDGVAANAGRLNGKPHGRGQRTHVIAVALGGVIGVFLLAEQRVLGGARPQAPLGAIENRDANAESAEIDTGYDTHENLP